MLNFRTHTQIVKEIEAIGNWGYQKFFKIIKWLLFQIFLREKSSRGCQIFPPLKGSISQLTTAALTFFVLGSKSQVEAVFSKSKKAVKVGSFCSGVWPYTILPGAGWRKFDAKDMRKWKLQPQRMRRKIYECFKCDSSVILFRLSARLSCPSDKWGFSVQIAWEKWNTWEHNQGTKLRAKRAKPVFYLTLDSYSIYAFKIASEFMAKMR